MNRGQNRQKIFLNDEHRQSFLNILQSAHKNYGVVIHGYCLMDNHYHLIIETSLANLSAAMRHINGVYTQKFNIMTKRDGSLFRGRYKAILIDADSYLLELSRYVHRNAIATKKPIVTKLQDYKWSSYRAFIGLVRPPKWLDVKKTLSMISQKKSRKFYKNFVLKVADDKFEKKFYAQEKFPTMIAKKSFKKEVLKNSKQINLEEKIKLQNIQPKLVVQEVAKVFEVVESSILSNCKGINSQNFARKVAIYLCQKFCNCNARFLAEYFGFKNASSVSNAINFVKKNLEEDDRAIKVGEVERRVVGW